MPHWAKYAVFTPPEVAWGAACGAVEPAGGPAVATEIPAAAIRAVAATVAVLASRGSRGMGGPPELKQCTVVQREAFS
ncbi:hypothetical protein GCM10028799_12680 [Kribbella italica]